MVPGNSSASGQRVKGAAVLGNGQETPGQWWQQGREKETSPSLVCRQEDFGLDE